MDTSSTNPENENNYWDASMKQVPPLRIDDELNAHPLSRNWSFWFTKKQQSSKAAAENYLKCIRLIGTVYSVDSLWNTLTRLTVPSQLNASCDYAIFQHGTKPIWEDESNKRGGKWILRLRKGVADKIWERLILAITGESFPEVSGAICGAVLSIRYYEDIVALWDRDAQNETTKLKLRDSFKRLLRLPEDTVLEYKAHDDSLRDRSSFRNTNVFKSRESLSSPVPKQQPTGSSSTSTTELA